MIINNKNNIFERISLSLLFIMGFISGYLGFISIINCIIVFLFFTLILLSKDFRKSIKDNWIVSVIIIVLFLLLSINIILSNNDTYLLYNVRTIVMCILIPYMLLLIYKENNHLFDDYLNNKFKVINIFWLINIVVLFFQVQGTGLLIKNEWFNTNPLYIDHCSGLFGYSGTHLLTFFSSFVMIYNFYYSKGVKDSFKRRAIIIYNIVTIVIMCILSMYNDNDSIFIIYLLFLFYLFFIRLFFTKTISKKISILITIASLTLLFYLLIYNISFLNNFFKLDILEKINSIYAPNANSKGSSERLLIFYKAMSKYGGSKFGLGIGAYKLVEQNALGFMHFGISSIGIVTTLCGIWIYLLLVVLFSKIYTCTRKKRFFFFLYNFVLVGVITIYTQFFTNEIEIFWLTISAFLLNSMCEKGKKNENN